MRKIRFTIGGLMGVVVVVAIDFAALVNADVNWIAVLSLLTHGTLGLAVLGIVLRRGAERAWWVGFFVFGWSYLHMAPWGTWYPHKPPTLVLLEWLRTKAGTPPLPAVSFGSEDWPLRQLQQCIWALPAALLGGLLGRLFFASTSARSEPLEPAAHQAARPLWKRWVAPAIIGLAGLGLIQSVMVIWWTSDVGLWAGGTFLLTCVLLGIAVLGALLGRGKRREIWIGAAIFGVGYFYLAILSNRYLLSDHIMVLPRATDHFLNAIRPLLPPGSTGTAAANVRILETLERPIAMHFPDGTSLRDMLDYIRKATATPKQPTLPIYVNPFGLQAAERSLDSTVQIDLEGVALKTTLDLGLRQLGLYYFVKDGCLRITCEDEELKLDGADPFQIVGHCLLALLAAGIGGVLAPLVAAVSRERPGRTKGNDAPAPAHPLDRSQCWKPSTGRDRIMRKIRFTIGGLMGVVVVLAIGLTALRNSDAIWAGLLLLLMHGMLGLAILGIVLLRQGERAWWLGFAVFGWGYLYLASALWGSLSRDLLTLRLLMWFRLAWETAPLDSRIGLTDKVLAFFQVAHCLWALLAAILGGTLARTFFAFSTVRPESSPAIERRLGRQPRTPWLRPAVIGLAGLVLCGTVVAIWSTPDAGLWSGGMYLLTCTVLGMSALGALFGRGKSREIWIGATLFGVSYLYMALAYTRFPIFERPRPYFVTDQFLNSLRRQVPLGLRGMASDGRVYQALEQPIPMRFPEETTLDDVLKHIKQATATPDCPELPIYVDPLGLQEAERSLGSTVSIDLEGVPLKSTLRLCLRQLGLAYMVEGGCLDNHKHGFGR